MFIPIAQPIVGFLLLERFPRKKVFRYPGWAEKIATPPVEKPVEELHRRPEGDMLFVEHDITSKLCPPLRPKT